MEERINFYMQRKNRLYIKILDDFRKLNIYDENEMILIVGVSPSTWKNLKTRNYVSAKTLLKISKVTNVGMLDYYDLMIESDLNEE